ncbi:nuclear transport factor 2 family protein [Flavobacterium soyangense]|uniref:Nuclear transport factor 2 family protein n=1 Tax=Flavobacterium soyangense TaxID=2023265 RepID=A0A930UDW8_9FLAO|nr:nuclear transport factor 2 family protein [Flavobacterium soyangense]MBF2709541.1 nuclear transport factor 2 family protein [Flavobacterium soyangense]
MTIEQTIEKQMQAYDNRDIDSMMSVFSEDITIIDFLNNKILINGINECRKMYVDLFKKSPNLRAEIINTITFDNKVIVQEYIHGRNGSEDKMEQVVIFEVNNKKINRINIIKELA